jgi:hypothetical protein
MRHPFATSTSSSGYIVASPETAAVDWGTDAAVHALERIFLDGKFYRSSPSSAASVQLRASPPKTLACSALSPMARCLGEAHMTLLLAGDILSSTRSGFAPFALRDRDDQTLTRWIFILLASPIAWYALL